MSDYRKALVSYQDPSKEPITLDELKDHLRITDESEDANLWAYLRAARRNLELWLGRSFLTQTWDYYWDSFPCGLLRIPAPPLQSVTHIKYTDPAGVLQTWSSALYQVDLLAVPPRVQPVYGESWPLTRSQEFNAVTARVILGYGDTGDTVPEDLRVAVRVMATTLFEHREDTTAVSFPIPRAVMALAFPYRVEWF